MNESIKEYCNEHKTHIEIFKQHENRLEKHDEKFKDQEKWIRDLANRVPGWVCWAFSGAGFLIGALIAILGVLGVLLKNGVP